MPKTKVKVRVIRLNSGWEFRVDIQRKGQQVLKL